MRFAPRTIAGRIGLASALALFVAVGVFAVALPLLARQHDTNVLGDRLARDARLAAELAVDSLRARDADALDSLAGRIAQQLDVRVTFVAPEGTVLGDSHQDRRAMENHAAFPEVAAALADREGRSIRYSPTADRDLLYAAAPARDSGRVVGAARVALPLASVQSFAGELTGVVVAAALAGGLAGLLVAILFGRAISRPIVALAAQAERLPREGETFSAEGSDEVERLAASLRRMASAVRDEHRAATTERDRLASLLDELGDAILIADAADRVVLANTAARRMLGVSRLEGRPVAAVVRDHEILEALGRARAGAEATAQVERNEPRRFLRVIARPLEGGEVLLAIQDLSTLRRLETVRRDFIANLSHELRTPIASLKAMAETLEEGAIEDPAAARDFVGRMHREVEGLAQLVTELLSLSRLEAGEEPLELAVVDPAELVADVAERMSALAERARVELVVEVAPEVPGVRADREKIAHVLVNLIHNAVRFSDPGGVVRIAAERIGEGRVAFSVRDAGAGILRADLERIFERFYKVDRARAAGGTGLGLAIAKHLVQAHGGEIRASSPGLGRGAVFTFTLPAA